MLRGQVNNGCLDDGKGLLTNSKAKLPMVSGSATTVTANSAMVSGSSPTVMGGSVMVTASLTMVSDHCWPFSWPAPSVGGKAILRDDPLGRPNGPGDSSPGMRPQADSLGQRAPQSPAA